MEITVADAAAKIGISQQMVLRYLKRRYNQLPRLEGRKLPDGSWRVSEDSVRQFVRPKRGNPRWRKGRRPIVINGKCL